MLAISPHQKSEATLELLQCWQEWSGALKRYVAEERLSGITQQDYHERHAAVLRAIDRRRRESGDDPLLRKIETLATPWVSLEAFRLAPDSIRKDLLEQCDEYLLDLCGYQRRGRRIPWRTVILAAAVGLVSAYLVADLWLAESHSVVNNVQYQFLRAGSWIRHWSILEKSAVAVLGMLAIGWWTTHNLRSN